jgi:hypothetical protein
MRLKALSVIGLILLTGCSSIQNLMPSNFDNAEFMQLSEMRTAADWSPTCHPGEIKRITYISRTLQTYSGNTLNPNIAKIYSEINSLAEELYKRENPSEGYCKIKRKNIVVAIDSALEIFGGRVK